MTVLVLLRHGESVWNKENRFTGWTDVDLSPKGVAEAEEAGKILKTKGFTFDLAFTSVLIRAERTLEIVLDEMDLKGIEVFRSWRLNERHYGALQGLNKAETAKKYGDEQVAIWRRSYAVPPPALTREDSRFPGHDPLYKNVNAADLPLGESLKDTVERFLPYWKESIEPFLRKQKRVIIVAHGNTLRALVKYLDGVSEEDIVKLDIPTGVPLVYDLNEALKPVKSYYLTSVLIFFIIIGAALFNPSVSQAKSDDDQTQIILLNDSAAALEDSDPELSKSLTKFADEKEKEWEDKGANKDALPTPITDKELPRLREEINILNMAAHSIQPTYPLIAQALKKMAHEIDRSIEIEK